jgi:hypothetical protein
MRATKAKVRPAQFEAGKVFRLRKQPLFELFTREPVAELISNDVGQRLLLIAGESRRVVVSGRIPCRRLEKLNPSTKRRVLEKFALAALGSSPWVGGFISARASVKTEEPGLRTSSLQTQRMGQHQAKVETLSAMMPSDAKSPPLPKPPKTL